MFTMIRNVLMLYPSELVTTQGLPRTRTSQDTAPSLGTGMEAMFDVISVGVGHNHNTGITLHQDQLRYHDLTRGRHTECPLTVVVCLADNTCQWPAISMKNYISEIKAMAYHRLGKDLSMPIPTCSLESLNCVCVSLKILVDKCPNFMGIQAKSIDGIVQVCRHQDPSPEICITWSNTAFMSEEGPVGHRRY